MCWIVENDLLENGADLKFKEYAVNLALDVLASTLIDKIRSLPATKQSEKTLLISYYIRLLPSADNFDPLKEMAVSKKLRVEGKDFGPVNKLQRYTCLRKCAAVV